MIRFLIHRLLVIFLCMTSVLGAMAQPGENMVGVACPDFYFDKIVNYKSTDASISDFRGKWLLLDFWGASCPPCVKHIPALESLQEKFADKLKILLIGIDGEKYIRKLYRNMEIKNRPFKLPSAIDSTVYRYFGFNGVPDAQVWINDKGVIMAITGDESVTEENVQRFMEGGLILPVTYRQKSIPEHFKQVFLSQTGPIEPGYKYGEVLTSYIPGLRSTFSYPQPYGIHAFNATIVSLFMIAYSDTLGHMLPYSRIKLETRDSALHPEKFEISEPWMNANLFCFQLIAPGKKKGEMLDMMKGNLARLFDYSARREKRKTRCLVLIRVQNGKIKTIGKNPFEKWDQTNVSIGNKPLSSLLSILEYYNPQKIILDESGYNGNVDITVDGDATDLSAVRKSLARYGLDMIDADRDVDMLVIRNKVLPLF